MSNEFYIFAGGGTGGHLYPGLAVADELQALRPEARIVFACSDRPVDWRILEPTPHVIVAQPVRSLPRRPFDVPGFTRAYLRSAWRARRLIRDLQPAAVLGLGGFAAGPVTLRAAKAGVRTGLLNPDAVPGKANHWLAGRVDAVFTQFEGTAGVFPPRIRGQISCVGCPIRTELLGGDRGEAIAHFGLQPDRKTLLVFGGSALAESIDHSLSALAVDLSRRAGEWQLLHIAARPGNFPDKFHVRTLDYCDRMDLAYAAADLAVCRGGASTVAELAATATPAIILPYPHHRDEHQRHNAQALVDTGAAVCITDACDSAVNAAALRKSLLPIMDDDIDLARMTAAAGQLAKPNAARDVAEWLVFANTA